jgi:hypothetical protein
MPFQVSLYRDRPPTTLFDGILIHATDGTFTYQASRTTEDGRLIQQHFSDSRHGWFFDAFSTEVYTYSIEDVGGGSTWTPRVGIAHGQLNALTDCDEILRATQGDRLILRVVETSWRGSCVRPYYAEVASMQANGPRGQQRYVFEENPYLADLVENTPLITEFQFDADGRLVRIDVNALRDGPTLLHSVALERDERIAPPVLDSTPPDGITRNWSGSSTPSFVSFTINEFRTASGVQPYMLANAELETIQRGSPVSGTFIGDTISNPLVEAYYNGAAFRFTMMQTIGDRRRFATLYQGSVAEFGSFLRNHATWNSIETTTLIVEGRNIPGWTVSVDTGQTYLITQIDDTLLAIEIADGVDLSIVPVP